MAEPLPPIEVQTQAKTVQELAAISFKEVPERYIFGALESSIPMLDVPTVNLDLLASSSNTGHEELEKLRSALISCAFRGIINEYAMKLQVVAKVVLKAMASSLNMDENRFLHQYGDQATMQARFNFYPICPRPELVLGIKNSFRCISNHHTVARQRVEGLQILKDDQWFSVPIILEALLINVGDQVEVMAAPIS